jgi:rubrerythrin
MMLINKRFIGNIIDVQLLYNLSTDQFRMTQVISNVEYSILRALGTDADFLYDTVDSYIKDAQGSNRSDLVELWQTIKQDRQKHANMLREALEKEIHR